MNKAYVVTKRPQDLPYSNFSTNLHMHAQITTIIIFSCGELALELCDVLVMKINNSSNRGGGFLNKL